MIRRDDPKALKKIIVLDGDVTEVNLGLNHEDAKILIDNVSVVFHVAATTRFNEELK